MDLKVVVPRSSGMPTFVPKVRVKGVFPVGARGIVRYAHRTRGSSFTHFRLEAPSLFFKYSSRVLLLTSTWPFDCG